MTKVEDFEQFIRPVFWQSTVCDDDYLHSDGGTGTVIEVGGRVFFVTAGHVQQANAWSGLCIPVKVGSPDLFGIKFAYRPSQPTGNAVGSDLMDVVALELDAEGLNYDALPIPLCNPKTNSITTALVAGYPKKDTSFSVEDIKVKLVYTRMRYVEPYQYDVALSVFESTSEVRADFQPEGLSGACLFDDATKLPCGIVLRAGVSPEGVFRAYVLDWEDISWFLRGVVAEETRVEYQKARPEPR